jgi:nitrogenase molybdenum-iron protein beta chain
MLGGVLAMAGSMPRTIPIVHGAQGCGNNLSSAISQGGYLGAGYCGGLSVPSTNVGESEVVFGGSEKLAREIENAFKVMDGDLFVLTTACMTDIIGDDVKGVLSSISNKTKPIVFLETGGFKGTNYYGYTRFIQELFLQYIPKSEKKRANMVNIFGLVPGYDPFFRGDLEEIKRLLALIGVEANTFITNDESIDNIRNAGEASLNIIVSRVYGTDAAEAISKSHGIPYIITDLPIGPEATAAFLRLTGKNLNIDNAHIEQAVKKETESYYKYINRCADAIVDFDFQNYGIVVANATGALPYAKYLDNEIGWIIPFVFITDELSDTQKKTLTEAFNAVEFAEKPELVFETDTLRIQQHIEKSRPQFLSDIYYDNISPVFVLGSTLESKLADSLNGFYLAVSYPIINRMVISKSYAGYKGGLNLLEDLIGAQVAKRI